MILVSQAPVPLPAARHDSVASTRHALANGFALITLPVALMHVEAATPALAAGAPRPAPSTAIWPRPSPSGPGSRAVDTAVAGRISHLLRRPEALLDVFDFDRAHTNSSAHAAGTVVSDGPFQPPAAVQQVG